MPRGLKMLVSYSFLFLVATNATSQAGAQLETSSQPGAAPLVIAFQDAMARARNLPQFLSANTDLKVAHEPKVQARAALLPSVTYNTQFFYTQGNGTQTGVFVANNFVHEYISQVRLPFRHCRLTLQTGGSPPPNAKKKGHPSIVQELFSSSSP